MTSVQERLQLKRMALDNWSTREKLCLASAVSCSGDQNWMSVSRSLKMLYGANRPADWFSQKSCAVQYGELLENVETPKRKKRSLADNQTITETPTESILRKLTQERVAELKGQIQKDQEEYAKLREEIMLAQSSNVTEAQLKEMWAQIEQEQEQKIVEQQKYSQWLKEREDRKTELQRAWRPGSFSQTQSNSSVPKLMQLNTSSKQEEMEVDETNPKHGTAPLLTSLLKSSSPAPSSTAASSTSATTASARITAPTITNLLTGNTSVEIAPTPIPAPQPTQQYHPIHTQPLTGPIPSDHHQHVIPSPSQAAPTLSMLLESKGKEVIDNQEQVKSEDQGADQAEAMEIEDGGSSPNKDDDQQLMEVFNGLIPDNIDELADILTNNNAIILNPELLEEESILEDVESLMDEHGETGENQSQATGNDAAPQQREQQSTVTESKNLPESSDSTKIKDQIKEENENSLDPLKNPKIEDSSGGGTTVIKEEVKKESLGDEDSKKIAIESSQNPTEVKEEKEVEKVESSDDSSDNATLQTIKEKIQVDHKVEESTQYNDDEEAHILLDITTASFVPDGTENVIFGGEKTDDVETEKLPEQEDVVMSEDKQDFQSDDLKKFANETSEVIILTEDSDSDDTKVEVPDEAKEEAPNSPLKQLKQIHTDEQAASERSSQQNSTTTSQKDFKGGEDTNSTMSEPTATITIIDIDDDDAPIEITKDEKHNKNKRDYSRTRKSDVHTEKKGEDSPAVEEKQNLSIRKLKERDGSESPLVDDDNSDAIPRTRRRYSSTPVIDSIPSSPASSDDREYKAWKKSILMVYNRIATHRHASIFLRPVTEDVAPNYKTIVYRPMDLHTIKKNIENGAIRSTIEFQRDVMLMCQNAIMYNKRDNNVHTIAREMMAESVAIIDSLVESAKKENEKLQNTASSLATKVRGRKSQRLP